MVLGPKYHGKVGPVYEGGRSLLFGPTLKLSGASLS